MTENRVYLDTSVLTAWLIILEKTKQTTFPKAAKQCEKLLNYIRDEKLNCEFQVSEWALSEMIQTLRDRAILQKFLLDGYEISSFNRHKSRYPIGEAESGPIHDAVKNFEFVLTGLKVQKVELDLQRYKIHEYCLKYSLETADAIHLLGAVQNSDYLVTIDTPFKSSDIKEIKVIGPEALLSNSELRKT